MFCEHIIADDDCVFFLIYRREKVQQEVQQPNMEQFHWKGDTMVTEKKAPFTATTTE